MRHRIGSLVRRKVYINIEQNKEIKNRPLRIGAYASLVCLVIQNQVNHGQRKNRLELEPLFFEGYPVAEEGEEMEEAEHYIKEYQHQHNRVADRSWVSAYPA